MRGSGFGVQGSEASSARKPTEVALVVRIPRGIRSKEKLLAILADRLRFPRYFGYNWDALEECLRDLSWLPPGQRVEIVHQDLPFGDGENRATYLDILTKAAAAPGGRFRVILPQQQQEAPPA
jgi:RNAse (barnase) inhibitor barstar